MSCVAKCKSTGRRQWEALCSKNIPSPFQINCSPFNTSINPPAPKQSLIYLHKIKDILLREYIYVRTLMLPFFQWAKFVMLSHNLPREQTDYSFLVFHYCWSESVKRRSSSPIEVWAADLSSVTSWGLKSRRRVRRRIQVWAPHGRALRCVGPLGRRRSPLCPLHTYNFRAVRRGYSRVWTFCSSLRAITNWWGSLCAIIQIHCGIWLDSTDLAGASTKHFIIFPFSSCTCQITAGQVYRVWLQRMLGTGLLRDDVVSRGISSWAPHWPSCRHTWWRSQFTGYLTLHRSCKIQAFMSQSSVRICISFSTWTHRLSHILS